MTRGVTAPRLALVALACLAALGGCSNSEDDEAPAACLGGSESYVAALRSAPNEVRLQGETPISECLVPDQDGGELAQVGKEMIDAATELNAAVQTDPTGPEALQLGYLVGAIIGWGAGDYLGRPWLERHGRWLHLNTEKLDRAERWFDRWEEWAVFLGRITPVMRSFISVPAGVFRARFGPYVWLTLLGSAIWCFAFAGAGWAAGASWEQIDEAFHYVEYVIVAVVLAAVAGFAWYRLRRRRRPADRSAGQDFPA